MSRANKPTHAAYFNYIGSIELPLDLWDTIPQSGAADIAIDELMLLPEVIAELSEIEPENLIRELQQYGVWDDADLGNHEINKTRILWLAHGNILEETD